MPRRAEDKEAAEEIARRLGTAARAARAALGLTQEGVSEQVGITSEALGRIERGTALPSFTTLMGLCSTLKVTPDSLLQASPNVSARATAVPGTKELQQIQHYARRLDARRQRLVLGLIRELSSPSPQSAAKGQGRRRVAKVR